MTINIQNSQTLLYIQQQFTAAFPFLKIEFFQRPHTSGTGSSRKYLIPLKTLVSAVRKKTSNEDIVIEPGMTVARLEQLFQNELGLNIQVFRRSGNLWLETTATDNWTLAYQNEQGKNIDDDLQQDEKPDYHEQE
ncbi:MAG: hypothetical protein JNM00_08410 [Flavobacteriales bacterium]|nr:hypothetical protein [Flavobacteriales bacterium]